jgi:hypothetical protein
LEAQTAIAISIARWRKYAALHDLTGPWVARAHRYGMEAEDLHGMYLRQGGRCYLCNDPLLAILGKFAIDHDHKCCPGAGRSCGRCVRGIACPPCNKLIGAAQDDPDRLRRVADNLEAVTHRLSNSSPACLRCQKWYDDCECAA